MIKRYISKALWPEDSGIKDKYGRPESKDSHDTEAQAKAVCRALGRDGFGGEGKVFPIKTWVE